MTLVERLGFRTLDALYAELDNNDIMEWAAYDLLKNPESRKKLDETMDLERQKTQGHEEEANRMTEMLLGLS